MPEDERRKEDADRRALELIRASGVLNPNATMTQIMDLTQRIAELDPEAAHTDTIIHRHFIWRHEE